MIENTAEALADAAEFISKHPDKAQKVGDAARKTVYRSWEDAISVAYERYLYLIELNKDSAGLQAKRA